MEAPGRRAGKLNSRSPGPLGRLGEQRHQVCKHDRRRLSSASARLTGRKSGRRNQQARSVGQPEPAASGRPTKRPFPARTRVSGRVRFAEPPPTAAEIRPKGIQGGVGRIQLSRPTEARSCWMAGRAIGHDAASRLVISMAADRTPSGGQRNGLSFPGDLNAVEIVLLYGVEFMRMRCGTAARPGALTGWPDVLRRGGHQTYQILPPRQEGVVDLVGVTRSDDALTLGRDPSAPAR